MVTITNRESRMLFQRFYSAAEQPNLHFLNRRFRPDLHRFGWLSSVPLVTACSISEGPYPMPTKRSTDLQRFPAFHSSLPPTTTIHLAQDQD